MAPDKRRQQKKVPPSNNKGNNGGSSSSGEKNTVKIADVDNVPPSNNKGNSGGSSSSGEKNTVKTADADNVSHFLELFAAQIERSDNVGFHVLLKCFRNYYTVQEATDLLIEYKMRPFDAASVYAGMVGQLKSTVQEEYEKLSLAAAHERSTAQQYSLEVADTATEFLQIFANITQRNKEMTTHLEVFLKCLQHYSTLEETTAELRKYCNMDENEVKILYYSTMSKMNSKVKKEFQTLCFNAAHENQKVPAKNEIVHGVRSFCKLEDADSATEFLEILALQTQEKKERASQQEVLLTYFQRFSTVEETIDELKRVYNMDVSDANLIYQRVMNRLKSNVRQEYQKLCVDAARGKKQGESASAEIVSSTFPELASTSNVAAILDDRKNDQTGSLSQPTDSLHHILGAMAEKMKQLLDSHEKMDDKVHMALQQMREQSNKSEQTLNSFIIEKMNQFDDKAQKSMQKMSEQSNKSEQTLNSFIIEKMNQFDDKAQKSMQKMREQSTDSVKAFMKDFLNNDFDRKIQKTINARFDAVGPAIARRVVTDVEKLVASAATTTDIQTEVKKAMSQVEEHLISKIDQCISRKTQNLQAAFSADLQAESAKHLSHLTSATDIRIEVEKAMSELEKHLISKIGECISGETQKLQADISAGLESCKTIIEKTASDVSALSATACLQDELGKLGFVG